MNNETNITLHNGVLHVRPQKFNSDEMKEELGARWDKKARRWLLPATSLNVITLVEWYGEQILDDAPDVVQDLYDLDWGFPGFEEHPELEDRAVDHPYWEDLYSFQREAVEYLVCNPHNGGVLGLSPGLGKTPTAIIAADILEAYKVLVVAPLTLAKNWGSEIDSWSRYYRSWSRSTASDKDPMSEVVITNHETLFEVIFRDEDGNVVQVPGGPKKQRLWINKGPKKEDPKTGKKVPERQRIVRPRESYFKITWDLIIIDESILLKNRKAVKVDVLGQLTKYSHQVWLLSGSPTAKHRDDLYPQVRTIKPKAFSSYWRFAGQFCVVEKGQWGWKVVSDRPDKDPHSLLRDFLFIRNQKDVLKELPDYIYDPMEVELNADQRRAFDMMLDEWIAELEEGDVEAKNRLAQATRMMQITSNLVNLSKAVSSKVKSSSAKEDLLVDLIDNDDIEFPLLVWTWFVPTTLSVADRLLKRFPDLYVDYCIGKMKAKDKDEAIEAYREGDTDVLVLQTGVGKFGHNLTNTRTVFYHDRGFDSDAYVQSLRRVKRIGLNHRPRLIIPRSTRSADPMVELNLAGKMESISSVARHDLKELLRSLGASTLGWAMDK